jgi:3-mercaptopyruvate sulfurtransferase SseA
MNQTFNREDFMNTIMIRLLSAVSLAVVAILGADLAAAAEATQTATQTATETTDKPAEPAEQKEEAKPAPTITEKTINEVENLLGKATIVDARGSGDEAIKGAIFLGAQAEDKEIHEKLKDKTAEIIVYCGSVSCPASMTLAERLIGLGYTNIAHYAGGIKEWTENSKPTDDTKEKTKA